MNKKPDYEGWAPNYWKQVNATKPTATKPAPAKPETKSTEPKKENQ